ncbi:MAG: GHKL domain-containing protein [Carnobacterium sp.]|nr:GHKL domain-containing protein [Carnobacterium sp.]
MKFKSKEDYAVFHSKIMWRFFGMILISFLIVIALYLFIWQQRMGDWIVSLIEYFMKTNHEESFLIYHKYFRGYKEIFLITALIFVFLFLLWYLFKWMTQYFREINKGIDSLLADSKEEIRLSPEMFPFEKKLSTVKHILEQSKLEIEISEQRKNDLVMYLAHDIRTPLTSIIGYLNLLIEEPDMPIEKRSKYTDITLVKAYHLEKMINEFFEITRYNSQKIILSKESIDLYYMLVQISDELSVLSAHGNTVVIKSDKNPTIIADANELARVFNNILGNAALYSYPDTEIIISIHEMQDKIIVSFQNKGERISGEKISLLFEKFYRGDESRVSNKGGTGIGLTIAKEIISLHGGTINVFCEKDMVLFSVELPIIR